ncbi:undecaprenyl-diphosphate phosphatase [uncultured Sphingomonas sp.]|uniref:undecaprenyl-diphosphate phosphatase n=1 Tax=uncultured Sphingomonas sp. TaxID=158754 RepID=UPI0035CA5AE9
MGDLISIILLGIVEGVTEFLPVSSTGHLILAGALLGYDAEYWKVFNIVIQLGAILAIVVLYWRTFWAVLTGLAKFDPVAIRFVRNILVAFVPAAVIGVLLHRHIEALLGSPLTVAVALIVGGIAILGIERFVKEGDISGVADIPLGIVAGIGFIQCLAMIPGVSRSGATILGALSLGVERRTAAEFSFFLAIPTMVGATALELVSNREALKAGGGVGLGGIAMGTLVAFMVALLVVRWFVGLVGKHGFTPFAWYRIGIGGLALIALLAI